MKKQIMVILLALALTHSNAAIYYVTNSMEFATLSLQIQDEGPEHQEGSQNLSPGQVGIFDTTTLPSWTWKEIYDAESDASILLPSGGESWGFNWTVNPPTGSWQPVPIPEPTAEAVICFALGLVCCCHLFKQYEGAFL